MTTRWEYRFVDLHRGVAYEWKTGEVFPAFTEEMREAGEDGWEAIGPVTVSYRQDNRTNETHRTVLMLKRPRSVTD